MNRLRKAIWNAFHAPPAWQTPPNKRPPPPRALARPAGLLLGSDKPRPSLGVPKGTPDPPYLHTLGLAAAPGPQRRHWPSRDGFVAKKKRGLGVGIADPKWAGLSHETMNPMRGAGVSIHRPNRVGSYMNRNTYVIPYFMCDIMISPALDSSCMIRAAARLQRARPHSRSTYTQTGDHTKEMTQNQSTMDAENNACRISG